LLVAEAALKHPAAYSPAVIDAFVDLLSERFPDGSRLLDPFAGSGRVHRLGEPDIDLRYETIGVELEVEWAAMHPGTIVGDATALPFPDSSFAMAATSPTYGNRMADHHEARDGSYRRTYRHTLGRPLSANNAGGMQWGDAYRRLHEVAWAELRRVLVPCGLFALNIKDHQRAGERIEVCKWHLDCLSDLGFELLEEREVDAPGFRFGRNHAARFPEMVYLLERSTG